MGGAAFVVESDRELREVIAAALAHDGFLVQAPSTTADVLAQFDAKAPALVVCSLSSSAHDGTLLCKELRGRSASVRVVLYFAETVVASATDWPKQLGCDFVIPGPFDYVRLRAQLLAWGLVTHAPAAPDLSFSVPVPDIPRFEPSEFLPMAATEASAADPLLLPMPLPIPVEEPLLELDALVIAEDDLSSVVDDSPLPHGIARTGELRDKPLPRLLVELYSRAFSGVLHLSRHGVVRRVYWKGGLPGAVDSTQREEELGALLIAHDRITALDDAAATRYANEHRCYKGEALVAMGVLGESELVLALTEQAQQKLLHAFAWHDGRYVVSSDTRPLLGRVLVEIPIVETLWRGVAEHYDLRTLVAYFDDLSDRYIAATELFAVHSSTLAPHLRTLDAQRFLDGQTTFGAALILDPERSLALAQALYTMLVIEMIRPEKAPCAPAPPTAFALAPPTSAPSQELLDAIAREYLRLAGANHFVRLGVEAGAQPEEVLAAYSAHVEPFLQERLPPDLPEHAAHKARDVRDLLAEACNVLCDEERGRAYAASLREEPPQEREPDPLVAAAAAYTEGQALVAAQKVSKALARFSEAVRKNPKEPSYRVALGKALLAQPGADPVARQRNALVHIQEAVSLDPAHVEANLAMAVLLFGYGQKRRAKPYIERVLLRAPENQEARRLLAQLGG